MAILGLCSDMLAVCRDMLAYAGSSIYSFWRVQNKRVHAAPATGCQMNRLIFCLLGGILVAFSSTLFCHVQPRCEKPYVETNSHLGRRIRCLEFATESLSHRIDDTEVCETWLQEGRWCIRARSKLSKSYVFQNSSHNLVKKPVATL